MFLSMFLRMWQETFNLMMIVLYLHPEAQYGGRIAPHPSWKRLLHS
jgi:hypothetical protein